MNRRLLLALYDRSGLGAYLPVDYNGHELEVAEHMAKFAELIVRECVKEIHVADVGDLKGKSYYLDKVAEHIEKYFGVEE